MAIKREAWDKAKVMFEGGMLLADIGNKIGINQSTVGRKAKKEGWLRSKNTETILNEVKSMEDKSRLNADELAFHDKEVARIFSARQKTNIIAAMGQDIIAARFIREQNAINNPPKLEEGEDLPELMSMLEVKQGIEANDRASITLGVNNRHAPPANIQQNTQNNTENITRVFHVVE